MAKKKPESKKRYQPTKWDWVGLEAEFMTGDEPLVSKFFKTRGIPKKSYERAAVGWGEKRRALQEKGLEILLNKRAREIATDMDRHRQVGGGLMKIGLDAILPTVDAKGQPVEGLKPESALEAAKIIQAGAAIQRNALSVFGNQKFSPVATRIGDPTIPGADDGEEAVPSVQVTQMIINMPSNGKELKQA